MGVLPELIVTLIAVLYVLAIGQWSRRGPGSQVTGRRKELLFMVLGVLLAPLVTGVLFGAGIYLESILAHHPNVGVAAVLAAFAYEFALGAAFIGGFPAHFFLKNRGTTGVRAYAIAGAVIGLLTGGILMTTKLFAMPVQDEAAKAALRLISFAAMGAASGASFWIIARPRQMPGKG